MPAHHSVSGNRDSDQSISWEEAALVRHGLSSSDSLLLEVVFRDPGKRGKHAHSCAVSWL